VKFLKLTRAIGGGVALAAMAMSASARAEWWQAETSHFIVYSESKKEDAEQFARLLERYDNALRYLQGYPIPGPDMGEANKVKVFRSGDISDIAYIAGAPGSGIAGFYIPRAGATVAFVPAREQRRDMRSVHRASNDGPTLDTERVLFHEYTHHFMLTNFSAAYPMWYSEGFAELYSTVDFKDDGSFVGGLVPQSRGAALKQLPDVRLSRLFDHKVKLTGLELYQSYAFGWLLSHYLNFNTERKGQLTAYLAALNKGEDSLQAAKRVFGDLDKLQNEVRRYKGSNNFPVMVTPPGAVSQPNVTMRQLPPAEESLMREYIRSQRGVDLKEGKDVARDLAGKGLAYPDSLKTQLIVAEANLDAQNFDEAETAAKRALALDPKSSFANFLMGAVFLARGDKEAGEARKPVFAKARPWLVKAHKLDLKDPRPMIGYYMSYYEAGEPVPEDALVVLEEAWNYASYDATYRLILARQLLDENKVDFARSVLSPIAFAAHGTEKENKIRATVDLIDAKKPDEARAKLAEIFKEAKDARDGKKKKS
jgi:tetratricopeptide (TPR) repeat protein